MSTLQRLGISIILFISYQSASAHADNLPDSLVLCLAIKPPEIIVWARGTPPNIEDLSKCETENPCIPCVKSIEKQGCKTIDFQTKLGDKNAFAIYSFSLDCESL